MTITITSKPRTAANTGVLDKRLATRSDSRDSAMSSSGSNHRPCCHRMPSAAVTITGRLATYDRPADSGNVVSRSFCPTCGAPVYSTNSQMSGMHFIRASSLDDPEVFQPQLVVYSSRAPSWDHMDDSLPTFEEMPPPGDMPGAQN